MNIRKVDYKSNNASEEFATSLKETGFGVLANHPIDYALVQDVQNEWNAFFNDERRFDYPYKSMEHEGITTQDGYVPLDLAETAKGFELADIKEMYHWYPWGRHPSFLSDKTAKLEKQMRELASELLGWVQDNLPKDVAEQLSMPLRDMIKDSVRTLFRVLYYPSMPESFPEGAVRAAEHGDINLITLLPAATESGLQVKDKNGNWLAVENDPGTMIINIADMLEECTAGYYPSTQHRVVNPDGADAKKARISLPLFLHARPEVKLSQRHTADSYWNERIAELNLDGF